MANNMQNTGKSLNEQIWGEGGTGQEGYKAQLEKEIANQAQTGTASNGYSTQDLQNAIDQANQNGANITGSTDSYSQYGHYTKDGGNGVLPGTGEEGWSYTEGNRRPTVAGTSGADEDKLSDAAYQYVQYCKQMYAQATNDADRAYWHNEAEKTRAAYGYSAGTDGSMYIPVGQLGVEDSSVDHSFGGYGNSGGQASGNSGSQSDLKGMLDAWQDAALKQSNGQIDYAVAKAVADLERALADAQPMFKEQAETVAREERQALDNSALYAEMRGDKGGIGQEQYNSIQNTAAQNHLTVQQAQTKLATDTQRQIADLRAQGEFEKADAALQITQQYLQQLIGLEQWAAEYNLSVDQFNESVRQWEAEYNMAMQQLQLGQNQWQAEFDAAQNRWQAEFDYGKQSDMANIGWALLESGVSLSKEQLAAMGIDEAQASQILMQQQLKAALNGGGTGKSAFFDNALDWSQKMLKDGRRPAEIRAYLEGLVDRGQITADESVHIYMDYLGLLINDFSDADSIPTTNTPTLKETLKMA